LEVEVNSLDQFLFALHPDLPEHAARHLAEHILHQIEPGAVVVLQEAAKELHRLVVNSGLEDHPEAGELEDAISRFICINECDPLDDV
jgi:hypothetical protein